MIEFTIRAMMFIFGIATMKSTDFIIVNEIGFASALGNLRISDQEIIANSKKDGTIDQQEVFNYNDILYFFKNDNKIDALVLLSEVNHLRAIKNFTKQSNVVIALINYLINFKNMKLVISPNELMTSPGFSWVLKLIKNPQGFTITDLNGDKIDILELTKEWEKAKLTKISGNSGLIISEVSASYKKMIIENENSLMPFKIFLD